MKIFCFGDSWVEGIGSELVPGSGKLNSRYDHIKNWEYVRKKYSWPSQLQHKIGNDHKVIRIGHSGSSNYLIYKRIIDSIYSNKIQKNDLVIISLSSIIREPLNFLYVDNIGGHDIYGFVNYSNSTLFRELEHGVTPDGRGLYWVDDLSGPFRNLTQLMYKDYLVNRFNYLSLYESNMNYICNLQIYFDSLGINYLFVNAFEENISADVFFYNQIKLKNWIFPHYTLQEYLLDKAKQLDSSLPYSVWEDDHKEVGPRQDGPHPNRIGYQLISDLMFDELIKRNFI